MRDIWVEIIAKNPNPVEVEVIGRFDIYIHYRDMIEPIGRMYPIKIKIEPASVVLPEEYGKIYYGESLYRIPIGKLLGELPKEREFAPEHVMTGFLLQFEIERQIPEKGEVIS